MVDNGSDVCIVGMQRNNFLRLFKVIKQWKFYLNLRKIDINQNKLEVKWIIFASS